MTLHVTKAEMNIGSKITVSVKIIKQDHFIFKIIFVLFFEIFSQDQHFRHGISYNVIEPSYLNLIINIARNVSLLMGRKY